MKIERNLLEISTKNTTFAVRPRSPVHAHSVDPNLQSRGPNLTNFFFQKGVVSSFHYLCSKPLFGAYLVTNVRVNASDHVLLNENRFSV